MWTEVCRHYLCLSRTKPSISTSTETYPGDSSLAFKVSTVDAFQGQECDIILICTTRTLPGKKISHLYDNKRTNVALSSKYHVFVLGNTDSLKEGGDPCTCAQGWCMFS